MCLIAPGGISSGVVAGVIPRGTPEAGTGGREEPGGGMLGEGSLPRSVFRW